MKYRILKKNEIIRKGDQAYDRGTRGWYLVDGNTAPVPYVGFRVNFMTNDYCPTRFRRKVK